MATNILMIDNAPAWRLHHHLPMLWPWFFDPSSITESRKFFTTLLDGAERFELNARRTSGNAAIHSLSALFEEIRPGDFFRQLGEKPDAILSFDASEIVEERHYDAEVVAQEWKKFFGSCEDSRAKDAFAALSEATLSPLHLTGGQTRDALALRAAADAIGVDEGNRAEALVTLLMGRPVSRAARSLTLQWIERARHIPIAEFRHRRSILDRIFPKSS